jgi:hypothetical protein
MIVSFASAWLCCGGHGGDCDGDGDGVGFGRHFSVGIVALFSITLGIVALFSITLEFVARTFTFEIVARFLTVTVGVLCDSFCLLFACFTCTDLSLARQAYGLDVSHSKLGELVGSICAVGLACINSCLSGCIV